MSTQITISEQPVALCQLLKIANLVSGGGEAKIVISEGYVLVNDEIEYQKRKKIYQDDIIEFNGEVIQVVLSTQIKAQIKAQNTHHKKTEPKANKKTTPKIATINPQTAPVSPNKRRPISF